MKKILEEVIWQRLFRGTWNTNNDDKERERLSISGQVISQVSLLIGIKELYAVPGTELVSVVHKANNLIPITPAPEVTLLNNGLHFSTMCDTQSA